MYNLALAKKSARKATTPNEYVVDKTQQNKPVGSGLKLVRYIKSKSGQFSEKGLLGYMIAIGFFVFMFIALTSPVWFTVLGFWFLGTLID